MDLKIKEEFKSLIPKLTAEEYEGLEKSIIQDGCRDKIITWKGYIIDGHNRYEICKKHNIAFEVLEKDNFETEADVKLWMIYNQIGKRNLTNIQKAELAIQIEKIEQVKAKARQGIRNDLKESNIVSDLVQSENESDISETNQSNIRSELTESNASGKSLEKAAKAVGVGYGTVYKTKQILAKAPEEVIEKVRKGDVSIDRAFSQIQRTERLEKNKSTQWPEGKYRIIYADPPWKYGDERSGMGGAVDQYDLMDLEDIKALPVADLAEKDSVLFMWATAPLMREAWEALDAWGFKYKTQFIWNKGKGPVGNYFSVKHEHLILATKGICTPDVTDRPNSVQTIERTGRHSEKPEEFRQIIEQLYTYGNKIELFARKKVLGWDAYGNEILESKELKKIAG